MSGHFADIKRDARRKVHETFAVPALYTDGTVTNKAVTCRWINRLVRNGDLESAGYAEIIEGVNKLVFSKEELHAFVPPLVLQRGGIVVIAKYDNKTFNLDTMDPSDGPINQAWNVTEVE